MNYKFSIITPEHQANNPYLLELYDSIKSQTYENWEWVIYLNGNCKEKDITEIIKNNKKVKLFNGESHDNI